MFIDCSIRKDFLTASTDAAVVWTGNKERRWAKLLFIFFAAIVEAHPCGFQMIRMKTAL
jgi:hypothetical protein